MAQRPGDLRCCCGFGPVQTDIDHATKATMIECLACNRRCGAPSVEDAVVMWNAAMQAMRAAAARERG